MITTLDIETTVNKEGDPSPFNPENRLVSIGINDEYFDRFNYENYGGTPILGIRGNVIIGHGISNDIAIKNMLLHSYDVASSGLAKKIKKAFK